MIPFPRIHIAESVMNRIYNAIDDTEPMFPTINPAPIPPADPIALGQEIDIRTTQPTAPVEANADPMAQAAATESIFGGSPLAGAIAALE